jgi:hypothetical protein
MSEEDELIKLGEYNRKFNEILGLDIDDLEIFRSKGLPSHMVKRKHYESLKYIDYLPEIIKQPDYIGINPNEPNTSIELVKRYSNNILVGIKLDIEKNHLYVATMHELQEKKLENRLHSGRLKPFTDIDNENKK